jgi:hypothetical protein
VRVTGRTLERVNEVYNMIVSGLRREQIIKLGREKHGWDVSPRTVDTYIALAKERFAEEAKVHRAVELGKAVARFESQYFKADARKDHRAASSIEEKIVTLFGLDEPREADLSDVDLFLDHLLGR